MKKTLASLACAAALTVAAAPALAQSYTQSYVQRDGTTVVVDRYGRTSYYPARAGYVYDTYTNSYRRTTYYPSNTYQTYRYSSSADTMIYNGRVYVRDRYGNYRLADNQNTYYGGGNYYGNGDYRNDGYYTNDGYYRSGGYNDGYYSSNRYNNYYYGSRYVRHNGRSYDQCSSSDRNAAAAVGLILGGVIGNQVSDSPAGAAIGAIIGGAVAREAVGDRRYCN